MNFLVVLPDLVREVKYFVAMMLYLVMESLIGVLHYLSGTIILLTRFHYRHNLTQLFPVSKRWFRAVNFHLLFQLELLRRHMQELINPVNRLEHGTDELIRAQTCKVI